MTTLRKAAEAALYALQWHYEQGYKDDPTDIPRKRDAKALLELRSALAEDATQPEPKPTGRLHVDGYFTWHRRDGYVLDAKLPCDFYLAPAAQPQQLEQVAEVHAAHLRPANNGEHWCREVLLYSADNPGDQLANTDRVKLYTFAPRQQESTRE